MTSEKVHPRFPPRGRKEQDPPLRSCSGPEESEETEALDVEEDAQWMTTDQSKTWEDLKRDRNRSRQ